MNSLKYYLLAASVIPFLPIMIWEGKRIRKTMPQLAEPSDVQGITGEFSKKIKLLSMGESTVAGVGVNTHRKGLTGHLATELSSHLKVKIEWHVFAKSGLTADTLNQKFLREKITFQPDVILIGLGGNDAFKFSSPSRWRKNLKELIKNVQSEFPRVPLVFANMPPTRYFPAFSPLMRFFLGRLTALHWRVIHQLAGSLSGVFFCEKKIEVEEWISSSVSLKDLFSDGVHPSGLTYQLWAKEIGHFVKDNALVKI